jgi:hypothetical protein
VICIINFWRSCLFVFCDSPLNGSPSESL